MATDYKELVSGEMNRRLALWKDINQFPKGGVDWRFLQEKKIIAGERGIYRDKERTKSLTENSEGVTVAVRHTGGRYPDELTEDGLIYHYPETRVKGSDSAEVNATKQCIKLNLPLFVVLEGTSKSTKEVKLGWVLL